MANLTRFDPRFDPLNALVDDLFKGFFVRPIGFEGAGETPRIKVDIAEKDGAYAVTAELPGVRKEDIQVTLDGAQLTLSAERKHEKETRGDERLLHVERSYGKVTRSFALPEEVDEAKAQATFRDGVLELVLPKKADAERKRITIQ